MINGKKRGWLMEKTKQELRQAPKKYVIIMKLQLTTLPRAVPTFVQLPKKKLM
jgi:hypothetical protein